MLKLRVGEQLEAACSFVIFLSRGNIPVGEWEQPFGCARASLVSFDKAVLHRHGAAAGGWLD